MPASSSETRVALVTGGSRGIGAAVARALAQEGWAVAINYVADAGSAAEVVAAITADGGKATPVQGDVASAADLDRMFTGLETDWGPVLALVNNAGIRIDRITPMQAEEEWNRVVSVNLSGAFLATRRALPGMLKARYGRIVNVGSVSAGRVRPGQGAYVASKAGLRGLTVAVAVETARKGVTVNLVEPGLVETDMTEGVNPGLVTHIPARRMGTPRDVAECVRFLASDAASYVTGARLVVDGGLTAALSGWEARHLGDT